MFKIYFFIILLLYKFSYATEQRNCSNDICDNESCYIKNYNFSYTSEQHNKEEDFVIKLSVNNLAYYKLVDLNNNFKDVTSLVLKDKFISDKHKKLIIKQNRKIYVFAYPSENIVNKGFISFIPNSNSKIIYFMRGGNRDISIPSPTGGMLLNSNYTILL